MTDPLAKPLPSETSEESQELAGNPMPSKPLPSENSSDSVIDPKGFSREFLMAFGTILLAELGDKTQLSTLLMTAESQSPWIVFAGASAALITTSLVGVIIGRWLARYLSPEALKTATGASLLFIAVLLIWDTVHL